MPCPLCMRALNLPQQSYCNAASGGVYVGLLLAPYEKEGSGEPPKEPVEGEEPAEEEPPPEEEPEEEEEPEPEEEEPPAEGARPARPAQTPQPRLPAPTLAPLAPRSPPSPPPARCRRGRGCPAQAEEVQLQEANAPLRRRNRCAGRRSLSPPFLRSPAASLPLTPQHAASPKACALPDPGRSHSQSLPLSAMKQQAPPGRSASRFSLSRART